MKYTMKQVEEVAAEVLKGEQVAHGLAVQVIERQNGGGGWFRIEITFADQTTITALGRSLVEAITRGIGFRGGEVI